MRLQEALNAGWKGEEAQRFTDWCNEVERIFAKRFGIGLWEVVGDWPSADTFTSGVEPDEAIDVVLDYVDAPGFEEVFG